MFVVIRNAGDYDSRYTHATVFYLTHDQAQKAADDATAFVKRAGFYGRDAASLDVNIRWGDDDGSDRSWDAHVAAHGGLPAGDPDLTANSFDSYGIHDYRVRQIPLGKVSSSIV